MQGFIDEFRQWLRQKVRVIIIKQWKKNTKIYNSLKAVNDKYHYNFDDKNIYKCANSRLGWYKKATGNVVNFILIADVLDKKKKDKPGLVNPFSYYLK